ncbi:MAG: tetratricopeptide repeat protein [Elusimicrobiales bacterium]
MILSQILILSTLAISQFNTAHNPKLIELGYKGIDYIYSIKPFKAREIFEQISKEYPGHPFGSFGIAMSKWAEFEYLDEQTDFSLYEEYHRLTEKAIEDGKRWVEKNPSDAYAMMCLGGTYGLLARLYLTQHKWIKAYFAGRRAVSNMRKALEMDPQLYDAYLGLGLWEYSAGTLPSIIKILSVFLISGNPRRGIEYLRLCADKGYFNKTAAQLLLIEILTQTDSKYSNPSLAVEYSRQLVKRYPQLAQMQFVLIVSLYEAKMYDEAEKEMKEYLSRIERGVESYYPKYYPRIYLSLGTLYMVKGELDMAYDYFKKASEFIEKEGKPTRWAVWALVRMGNIYDLKGERDMAVTMYKKALSYPDNWGFKDYIEENIKSPFNLKKYLATQLPPP